MTTDQTDHPTCIARIHVSHENGTTTSYPIAERTSGGWQSGVHFYPDKTVTKVIPLRVSAEEAPVTDQADHRADPVQAVAEAVAAHTPELIHEGPNGEDGGQHLYCVTCGVLPIDELGLQHGPQHVAEFAIAAARPVIERQAKAERDTLAGRLATVEALARKWALEWKENPTPTNAEAARYGAAKVLRAALAGGTTTNPQEADQ